MPIIATNLGAEIIEVHVKMERGGTGPDHKASLDVWKFKQMVNAIRGMDA